MPWLFCSSAVPLALNLLGQIKREHMTQFLTLLALLQSSIVDELELCLIHTCDPHRFWNREAPVLEQWELSFLFDVTWQQEAPLGLRYMDINFRHYGFTWAVLPAKCWDKSKMIIIGLWGTNTTWKNAIRRRCTRIIQKVLIWHLDQEHVLLGYSHTLHNIVILCFR